MKSFLLNIKEVAKDKFFIIFITILILLVIFSMKYYEYMETEIINNLKISYEQLAFGIDWEKLENEEDDFISAEEYKMDSFSQASKYYNDDKYKEYNLNMARFYLVVWEQSTVLSDEWNSMLENDRKISPQEHFGQDWEDVKEYLNYPDFLQSLNKSSIRPDSNNDIMNMLHYLDLVRKDLEVQYRYSTKPWSIVYNFLQNGFSKIIIIISLVFGASIFSKQFENRTMKTKLNIGTSRNRCLLDCYYIAIVSTMIIFLIPLILLFIIQSIKHGLSGFDYPVLLDKYILKNWKPDEILPLSALNILNIDTIGLSTFVSTGTAKELIHRIIYISLWKNILITLIISTLSVVFWSSIGLIVAVFSKSSLKAILLSMGIYVLSYLPSIINEKLTGTVYDLPRFTNVSYILQGLQRITLLQITSVYIIGTIGLLFIALIKYRKMDIIK